MTESPRKPGEEYPQLEPLCVCGHDVDDHGDGVVHTACCAYLTDPRVPEGTMCECEAYQPEQAP